MAADQPQFAPPVWLRSSGQVRVPLDAGWHMIECEPGMVCDPEVLATDAWADARAVAVPGTVAAALREAGELSLYDAPDLDARDYWYRCVVHAPSEAGRTRIEFQGLATLAEVWLDGECIIASHDMFLGYTVDVSERLTSPGSEHELLIRFASLTRALEQRHPRARWRTALVTSRHLRFYRTTLLGRMPSVPPCWAPVGPWRPVDLVVDPPVRVDQVDLVPRLDGSQGVVDVQVRITVDGSSAVEAVWLTVGDRRAQLSRRGTQGEPFFTGQVRIPDPEFWWPHTHGTPHRYAARLEVSTAEHSTRAELPAVGFRSVTVDQGHGTDFRVMINDVAVYCRGVCWIPLDPASLSATADELREYLVRLQSAGANMVRVSGVTAYECDDFYSLCDELGILVWQDFMFASMDYPTNDEVFRGLTEQECRYQLRRLGHRPCLAVLCGNSEVFQQAAMLGLPPETWHSDWFEAELAALCHEARPDVVYVSGAPSGGTLPFHTDSGVAHYFGVGAYRRSLADARLAEPKFAAECLAFANPPEPLSLAKSVAPDGDAFGSELYRAGTPRDSGADWDFADVTDHYVRDRFGETALSLKSGDPRRYLDVCRAAVGATMAAVQGQWRRRGASCGGSLIWTGRDRVPGPGWGVVDCEGQPKSAYFHLKRAWSPLALFMLDEGLNGLYLHLVNDLPGPVQGTLEVRFLRLNGVVTESAQQAVSCPAHDVVATSVEALIGGFRDSSHAYGFGPPAFDLVWAGFMPTSLVADEADSQVLETVFASPHVGLLPPADLGLTAVVAHCSDDACAIDIRSDSFAQGVAIDWPDVRLSDNYFDLPPNHAKRVVAYCPSGRMDTSGELRALNSDSPIRLEPAVGTGR